MRARMALKLAKLKLKFVKSHCANKPAHMLQVSPKATVPVLILPDGKVIEESLEIMLFAFKKRKHALGGNIHAACRASFLFFRE